MKPREINRNIHQRERWRTWTGGWQGGTRLMAFLCSSLVKCRIKFAADGIAMVLADLGY